MENRNKRVTRSMNRQSQKSSLSTSSKPVSATQPTANLDKRQLKATEGADAQFNVNAKGFPTFPDELLLEVMSYYPKPRDVVSIEATESRAATAIENATRRDTLLALSQTCRSLRRFFRPYIWSRIEVCRGILDLSSKGGRINNAAYSRAYNEELVRQLEIVTVRDPGLAEHVKLINVEVMDLSSASVLAELARCMALFPNLCVVKLGICPSTLRSDNFYKSAKRAFSRYSYPQVKVATLSRAAYPLLLSCPSVRFVDRMDRQTFLEFHGDSDFWHCIEGLCPKLESLTVNMTIRNTEDIAVRVLPNLRQVTLRFTSNIRHPQVLKPKFAMLEKLQRLQSIKIEISVTLSARCRQYIVDSVVQVLLKLQQEDKEDKEVDLRYLQESIGNPWSPTGEYKAETTYLSASKARTTIKS